MGDWCGSAKTDREPIKRSNGCGSRRKNQVVLRGNTVNRKKGLFFYRRGVFSLDSPLNR